MNFEKAFKELMAGKRIRRREWENLMHLQLVDGKVLTFKGENTHFHTSADILISNGWRVIDGDNKELTFTEAIEELKQKKCVTNSEWDDKQDDRYIFIDNGQITLCRSVPCNFLPTWKCLCASDWEMMK